MSFTSFSIYLSLFLCLFVVPLSLSFPVCLSISLPRFLSFTITLSAHSLTLMCVCVCVLAQHNSIVLKKKVHQVVERGLKIRCLCVSLPVRPSVVIK